MNMKVMAFKFIKILFFSVSLFAPVILAIALFLIFNGRGDGLAIVFLLPFFILPILASVLITVIGSFYLIVTRKLNSQGLILLLLNIATFVAVLVWLSELMKK